MIGGFVLDIAAWLDGNAIAPRAAFLVAVFLYGVSALLLRPVVEPRRRHGGAVAPAAPDASCV